MAHLAVISLTLLPPILGGAALVQTALSSDSEGNGGIGSNWSPVQNRLSPKQSLSASDPGMLWDMGKSAFEGWRWFEGSLFTLQVLLLWERLPGLCFRLAVKPSRRGGSMGSKAVSLLRSLGTAGTS